MVDWEKLKKIYKKRNALKELEREMEQLKMEKIKNSRTQLFSEKETAKVIGISYNKLRYLRQQKKISYCKIGCSIKYRLSQIEDFVNRSLVNAEA
jgi:hypothetical protein